MDFPHSITHLYKHWQHIISTVLGERHVSHPDLNSETSVSLEMAAPGAELRNRQRRIPDGLAHLCWFRLHTLNWVTNIYIGARASSDRNTYTFTVRGIACRLVLLNAWPLNTIMHAYTASPQLIGRSTYDQFKNIVSRRAEFLSDDDDIYEKRYENEVQDGQKFFRRRTSTSAL